MVGDQDKVITVSLKPYNRYGDILNTDLRFNTETKSRNPILIFCHGLKGFKDWGCFPYMLESIAEEEIFTVSFNFSYNGTGLTGNDEQEFTRLDLFAKNSISRELDDLEDIILFLIENAGVYDYDLNRLYLMGHSRGGGIAIIKASQNHRVKKLVTLASVAIFDRYTERLKQEWKEKGYIETLNTRTKQLMRFNYSYLKDLEKNSDKLDILKAISTINIPTLIIHGENDLSVECTEAQTLYDFSNKENTRLEIYKNTNHTFGAEHPFKGTSTILENVLKNIIVFLKA